MFDLENVDLNDLMYFSEKKEEFLSCMNDKVFKYLVKTKCGMKLITEIFKMISGIEIVNAELKDNEVRVSNKKVKKKRVDFLINDEDVVLNIEVNNGNDNNFYRNYVYINSLLINDVLEGEEYKKNKKYFSLNFSKKSVLSSKMEEYGLCSISKGIFVFPFLRIIEIDMEIVRKICYDNSAECIERLYRYIGMLCADEELLKKLSEGDELLMEVKEEIELFNNKGRFLISPEEEERIWENTLMHDAENKGKAIGEKNGILKTAKNMILNGFDNAMISKITGLRIDEIDKLCK